jgi:hypothetical protein
MEKFRIILDKIQTCIELQCGATESQLKSIWNDLSDAITECESNPANSKPANCAIFDVSGSLPDIKTIRTKSFEYSENEWKNGGGSETAKKYAAKDFQAGVEWLLGYIAGGRQ